MTLEVAGAVNDGHNAEDLRVAVPNKEDG